MSSGKKRRPCVGCGASVVSYSAKPVCRPCRGQGVQVRPVARSQVVYGVPEHLAPRTRAAVERHPHVVTLAADAMHRYRKWHDGGRQGRKPRTAEQLIDAATDDWTERVRLAQPAVGRLREKYPPVTPWWDDSEREAA